MRRRRLEGYCQPLSTSSTSRNKTYSRWFESFLLETRTNQEALTPETVKQLLSILGLIEVPSAEETLNGDMPPFVFFHDGVSGWIRERVVVAAKRQLRAS